jgi:hypothetical protein
MINIIEIYRLALAVHKSDHLEFSHHILQMSKVQTILWKPYLLRILKNYLDLTKMQSIVIEKAKLV